MWRLQTPGRILYDRPWTARDAHLDFSLHGLGSLAGGEGGEREGGRERALGRPSPLPRVCAPFSSFATATADTAQSTSNRRRHLLFCLLSPWISFPFLLVQTEGELGISRGPSSSPSASLSPPPPLPPLCLLLFRRLRILFFRRRKRLVMRRRRRSGGKSLSLFKLACRWSESL